MAGHRHKAGLWHFISGHESNLDGLLALLKPSGVSAVYAGNNFAYKTRITGSEMVTGRQNTQTAGKR
jgi:IS1 family transposase